MILHTSKELYFLGIEAELEKIDYVVILKFEIELLNVLD